MSSLVKYAHEFEDSYGVSFLESRLTETVVELMSINVLAVSSKPLYSQHIHLLKRMMPDSNMLPLLEMLRIDALASKCLGFKHLEDASL